MAEAFTVLQCTLMPPTGRIVSGDHGRISLLCFDQAQSFNILAQLAD
jgi:hypothetical protein